MATVAAVAVWGVTRWAGSAIFLVGSFACSGDDGEAPTTTEADRTTTSEDVTTTTAPERPASTTTTAYDPTAVEGQVEAAYLRSWDVYADAVYNLELDEQALAEVYAGEHLETKRDEIKRRIAEGRAALVRVEHDYTIQLVDETTAVVIDQYVNHQVLIDPATKEPIEPDPNERVVDATTVTRVEGGWRVTLVEELQ